MDMETSEKETSWGLFWRRIREWFNKPHDLTLGYSYREVLPAPKWDKSRVYSQPNLWAPSRSGECNSSCLTGMRGSSSGDQELKVAWEFFCSAFFLAYHFPPGKIIRKKKKQKNGVLHSVLTGATFSGNKHVMHASFLHLLHDPALCLVPT